MLTGRRNLDKKKGLKRYYEQHCFGSGRYGDQQGYSDGDPEWRVSGGDGGRRPKSFGDDRGEAGWVGGGAAGSDDAGGGRICGAEGDAGERMDRKDPGAHHQRRDFR